MREADKIGARSVAFPAISAGAFGYPLAEAARVAIDTVRNADTDVDPGRPVILDATIGGTGAGAGPRLDRRVGGAHCSDAQGREEVAVIGE